LRNFGFVRRGVGGVLRHWKTGRRAESRRAFMASAFVMSLVVLDTGTLVMHDVDAKPLTST
jgi:hypothetical protein